MPQASQSSYDRRAELEVLLAIPSAQDACGMEIRMEENEGKEKKQKKMQPKRWSCVIRINPDLAARVF